MPTYSADVLTDQTGRKLGSSSLRWDAFIQNLDVNGTLTLGSTAISTSGAVTSSAGAVTGNTLVSTVATGTAPLTVSSTTVVSNLNCSQLLGNTWAIPGTIGSTTPNSGAFTTLSASGVITSTVSTGTAPLTIASTTKCTNLNADLLDGNDWANPAALGSSTPAAITGTTVTGNTSVKIGSSGTALTQCVVYSQSLAPSSVAANTTAEQTFTVTGLATSDKVWVNKPTAQAGLGIVNCRASATNTLAITYSNNTGSPITPTTETYQIIALRS